MPDTPIKDSLDRFDVDTLTREAEIDVVAKEGGDAGVRGQVTTGLGKGWSVGAAGQWMRDAGWSVMGKFIWKGK